VKKQSRPGFATRLERLTNTFVEQNKYDAFAKPVGAVLAATIAAKAAPTIVKNLLVNYLIDIFLAFFKFLNKINTIIFRSNVYVYAKENVCSGYSYLLDRTVIA
jgi:hypothetical protein